MSKLNLIQMIVRVSAYDCYPKWLKFPQSARKWSPLCTGTTTRDNATLTIPWEATCAGLVSCIWAICPTTANTTKPANTLVPQFTSEITNPSLKIQQTRTLQQGETNLNSEGFYKDNKKKDAQLFALLSNGPSTVSVRLFLGNSV